MKKILKNIEIIPQKPVEALVDFSKRVAAEGIVLLKNDAVLPLINKTISIFGRIQTDYYKSGTGSGGSVNVDHVTSIFEALSQNPKVQINQELVDIYLNWIAENPYNAGNGQWASEPWSQVEMPLTEEIVKKAEEVSDVAVVIIGRTAGEDRDNYAGEGSFCLSQGEEDMLFQVTKAFKDVVVVLNVGNIIDMTFMDSYPISSLLYVWHGGMEGGRAVSDVLTGNITPSGKLANTIAYDLDDYPSTKNFGGTIKNFYQEDIYVGYRYFETFAKERVRYPFGFGLSYTSFEIEAKAKEKEGEILFNVSVRNTGKLSGKEVVQIYYGAPQGKLGQPLKQLAAFAKTELIAPGEKAHLSIAVKMTNLASYDDSGITGYKSAYVLEEGNFLFYLGTSVRDSELIYTYVQNQTGLVAQLKEAAAPKESFTRIKPLFENNKMIVSYEEVPTRTIDLATRIKNNAPKEYKADSNKKYVLKDVYDGNITMESFVAQLNNFELACLVRGEGMSSPKVTSGTAAAFGGVTDALLDYGIVLACASDGPSGIRMDSGQQATSLPNGTNMACTFNYDLIKELYYLEGKEMLAYEIDTLLGPGMNIHRNPLNGRNFEYQSEDPLLTGIMGQAATAGLQTAGVTGSIKHIACNNQELERFTSDSILSERALREIYLRGFEIAVKAGKSRTIMTSYNPVNGIWTAGNYDINTEIVHNEWGFNGLIMTDWWATINEDGGEGSKTNTKMMLKSQNDIYMVVTDSLSNTNEDNTLESLENGSLTKGEAQRSAMNICRFIMETPSFKRENNLELTDCEYQEEHWFQVQKNEGEYPVLNQIRVNGKSIPDFRKNIFTYYIEGDEKISPQIEVSCDVGINYDIITKKNCSTVIIKVSNGFEESLYTIIVADLEKRKKAKRVLDISSLTPVFTNLMTSGSWDSIYFNLAKPSYKTAKVTIDETKHEGVVLNNCFKDEIISYAVDTKSFGKYIFTLEVSCDTAGLAQIPVSILIDEIPKSTITITDTNGEWIEANAHIVVEAGLHYVSLRFGRSGLQVKQIKMTKHG